MLFYMILYHTFDHEKIDFSLKLDRLGDILYLRCNMSKVIFITYTINKEHQN